MEFPSDEEELFRAYIQKWVALFHEREIGSVTEFNELENFRQWARYYADCHGLHFEEAWIQ